MDIRRGSDTHRPTIDSETMWGDWDRRFGKSAYIKFRIIGGVTGFLQWLQNSRFSMAIWNIPNRPYFGRLGAPSHFAESENIQIFAHLPDTTSEYNGCDVFLLIGSCVCVCMRWAIFRTIYGPFSRVTCFPNPRMGGG